VQPNVGSALEAAHPRWRSISHKNHRLQDISIEKVENVSRELGSVQPHSNRTACSRSRDPVSQRRATSLAILANGEAITDRSPNALGADTNPSCGCHFPEGNSGHSRCSSAATPPDSGVFQSVYPGGIAAFASLNWSQRLESRRDTGACGGRDRWCRCARPPAMGCDPFGVGSCVEPSGCHRWALALAY
jgi:hypothetical protein